MWKSSYFLVWDRQELCETWHFLWYFDNFYFRGNRCTPRQNQTRHPKILVRSSSALEELGLFLILLYSFLAGSSGSVRGFCFWRLLPRGQTALSTICPPINPFLISWNVLRTKMIHIECIANMHLSQGGWNGHCSDLPIFQCDFPFLRQNLISRVCSCLLVGSLLSYTLLGVVCSCLCEKTHQAEP